jgi:hypothetical protein
VPSDEQSVEYDIFISWSGILYGRKLAEALKSFFEVLLIDAFVSAVDLRGGELWNPSIRSALKSARIGIVVLTRSNRYEPWLQFEAAAISIHDDKLCCPLVFDDLASDQIPSPLRAMQTVKFDMGSFWQLVKNINAKVQRYKPEILERHFKTYWPELEQHVKAAEKYRNDDKPDVKHITECVKLPETLQYLYDRWKAVESNPARGGGPDFKLHTLSGVLDDQDNTPIHEVKATDDHEAVYHLWANSEHGSTISARLLRDSIVRHHVRFHNGSNDHLSNVSFRPSGRRLLITENKRTPFRRIEFRVRIPKLIDPTGVSEDTRRLGDAEELVLGIRVMDRYRTHWQLCVRGTGKYAWYPIRCSDSEEWTHVRIDLSEPAPRQWHVFEADGNPFYHSGKPDFSVVMAVIIECGAGYKGAAVEGGGVFEVADFVIDTRPPGSQVQVEASR